MSNEEAKLLQSSLILLRTSMTEAEYFLETWREKYEHIEENYEQFRLITRQLADEINLAVKETKSFRDFQVATNTAKDLLLVAKQLQDIVTGPLVIIQAARNLAGITEQVTKLISRVGSIDTGDESHIFNMLTTEQINQVYQWVAENEAIRK